MRWILVIFNYFLHDLGRVWFEILWLQESLLTLGFWDLPTGFLIQLNGTLLNDFLGRLNLILSFISQYFVLEREKSWWAHFDVLQRILILDVYRVIIRLLFWQARTVEDSQRVLLRDFYLFLFFHVPTKPQNVSVWPWKSLHKVAGKLPFEWRAVRRLADDVEIVFTFYFKIVPKLHGIFACIKPRPFRRVRYPRE